MHTTLKEKKEIWKPIEGYEGLYEISSLGRVKSTTRLTKGRWNSLKTNHGRILKGIKHQLGYVRADLCKNGIRKHFSIHRLVANSFIPNTENKPQVNHKNGIKKDNRSENLEWCTSLENHAHAWKIGIHVITEKQRENGRKMAPINRRSYLKRIASTALNNYFEKRV